MTRLLYWDSLEEVWGIPVISFVFFCHSYGESTNGWAERPTM